VALHSVAGLLLAETGDALVATRPSDHTVLLATSSMEHPIPLRHASDRVQDGRQQRPLASAMAAGLPIIGAALSLAIDR
jgi:hypothetical protein